MFQLAEWIFFQLNIYNVITVICHSELHNLTKCYAEFTEFFPLKIVVPNNTIQGGPKKLDNMIRYTMMLIHTQ